MTLHNETQQIFFFLFFFFFFLVWKAHNSNYYENSDDLDSDYPIAEDSGFSSGKFPSIPKSTDSMTGMNSQVAPPLTQISEGKQL